MIVVGLMSGTSVDGIDAALVKVTGKVTDLKVELLSGETFPYPHKLREQILQVCGGKPLTMTEIATLDDAIATQFAQAALQIQSQPAELIGSHGQTIFHRPPNPETTLGYSWQLGRGDLIANLTHLTTISNFRDADIAAAGEGAPLVPKIDACLLAHPHKARAIQNLGGMGNVAYFPSQSTPNWSTQIMGWDTGPGNVLIDLAMARLTQGTQTYDQYGQWAAQGTPHQELVAQWLEADFFQQPPPKSTGRELFGSEYFERCWQEMAQLGLNEYDCVATLTELTLASIIHSYRQYLPQIPDEVLLCGGGSNNHYLRQRLQAELTSAKVSTTDQVGLNSNFKEAIAFAILAYWRIQEIPGNLPQVTGATQPMLLGEIHLPVKPLVG